MKKYSFFQHLYFRLHLLFSSYLHTLSNELFLSRTLLISTPFSCFNVCSFELLYKHLPSWWLCILGQEIRSRKFFRQHAGPTIWGLISSWHSQKSQIPSLPAWYNLLILFTHLLYLLSLNKKKKNHANSFLMYLISKWYASFHV